MKILVIAIVACTLGIISADKVIRKDYHSERDALAAIIASECGSCDIVDMYLTGSVVINRCNAYPAFPNEIKEVINELGQFHGRHTKHYKPTRKTRKVADDLLEGVNLIPNIYYFCTYSSKEPMKKVTIFGKSHKYGY